MPLLDLEAGHRGPLVGDVGPWERLYAVMAYPYDRAAREEMLAIGHLRARANQQRIRRTAIDGRLPGPAGPAMEWLLDRSERAFIANFDAANRPTTQSEVEVLARYQEQCRRGQGAGEALLFLLQGPFSVRGDLRHPTVKQALYLGGETWRRAGHSGSPAYMKRRVWQPFRSVAHLWASFRLLRGYSDSDPVRSLWAGDRAFDESSARGEVPRARLGLFLAVAEALRERGERHRLSGGSAALDSNATWRVPDHLRRRLPEVEPVPLPRLGARARRTLAAYRRADFQ